MYQNKPLTVYTNTNNMFVKEFFINILKYIIIVLHFNDNVTVNLMNLI